MVAIAVTLNNDHDAPHIEISLTGITNPGSAYTVYRIDNTGEEPPTPVRGLDQIIPSAATDAANDFEAPIGKSLSYKVVQGGDEDEDGPVTIPVPSDFGVCWLGSVHQPALNKRVIINEWSTDEYPTRILGQYRVLGRAKPVVLTDAWGHRTGNLKIVTDNDNISTTTWRQLYLLLTQGKTLHLRTASRTMTGEPDLYFEIESYSRTRIGPVRTDGKIPFIHDINFIEVDRPATAEESLGLRSYQDLLDDYTDYQDLLDSYGALPPPDDSYLGVLNRSA